MLIGILQAGHTPEMLVERHGDYGEMTAATIRRADPEIATRVYPVVDGIFPGHPKTCDGYVITGSRFGVYDPEPWIPTLEQFVRDCLEARVAVVGICFGHQLMAQAWADESRRRQPAGASARTNTG